MTVHDLRDTYPPFSSLPDRTWRRLMSAARLEWPGRDQILCRQGDPLTALHFLVDGAVAMTACDGDPGREGILEIVTPPDAFVLTTILTGGPLPAGARSLAPCTLVRLPVGAATEMIRDDPEFLRMISGLLARQCHLMVRDAARMRLLTPTQRVACYILSLAEDAALSDGPVVLPSSKRIVANRLGTTPESVSRALADLRSVGVSTRGRVVKIDDIEALRRYCRTGSPGQAADLAAATADPL